MRLSALQIILILVGLGIAGALSYQYGWRSRGTRDQLATIERENAEDSAARTQRLQALRDRVANLRSGLASCDALTDLSREPPACKNAAAAAEIKKALDSKLTAMTSAPSAAALDKVCTRILDDIDAILVRC